MEYNRLIPELTVSDFSRSLDFYTKVLGFKVEYQRDEDRFAFLSFQGSQIMIEQYKEGSEWNTGRLEKPYGRGINLQIEADDVAPLLESLEKAGHPIKLGPNDSWYRNGDVMVGSREFLVMDPDGYLLRFGQDLGKKPA